MENCASTHCHFVDCSISIGLPLSAIVQARKGNLRELAAMVYGLHRFQYPTFHAIGICFWQFLCSYPWTLTCGIFSFRLSSIRYAEFFFCLAGSAHIATYWSAFLKIFLSYASAGCWYFKVLRTIWIVIGASVHFWLVDTIWIVLIHHFFIMM